MPICLIVVLESLKQRFGDGRFHTNAEVGMVVRGFLRIRKPDFLDSCQKRANSKICLRVIKRINETSV